MFFSVFEKLMRKLESLITCFFHALATIYKKFIRSSVDLYYEVSRLFFSGNVSSYILDLFKRGFTPGLAYKVFDKYTKENATPDKDLHIVLICRM